MEAAVWKKTQEARCWGRGVGSALAQDGSQERWKSLGTLSATGICPPSLSLRGRTSHQPAGSTSERTRKHSLARPPPQPLQTQCHQTPRQARAHTTTLVCSAVTPLPGTVVTESAGTREDGLLRPVRWEQPQLSMSRHTP